MPTSNELRQQRAAIVAQARQLVDKAGEEKRDMTADENQQFDRAMADADKLVAQIRTAEQKEWVDSQEADLKASQGRRSQPNPTPGRVLQATAEDFRESLRAWCLSGTDRARTDGESLHRAAMCGINVNAPTITLRSAPADSTRSLAKGTGSAGGDAVPTNMVSAIVEKMAFYNPIRQLAFQFKTDSGADVNYPRSDDSGNSATIVDENASIGDATDPTFDKVTLKAWKYATTIVKVSVELLQDAIVDVEALLVRQFARRMGRGQAAHFVTGNGTTQPQGLATGAAAGVSLASGNALTMDKLIDWVYSLDRDYRTGATILLHDETIAATRKLKDGQGQYLWQPSTQAGQPDTLLAYPVEASNHLVSITSPGDNAVLGTFGNYGEHYIVRDVAGSMQITRLNELYAATGQVGFVMLMRTDGRLIGHSGCVKALKSFDAP